MELRKHYFLDEYVIIATERAKRPDQFKSEKPNKTVDKCFFCPGNEADTPTEIYRWPEGSENWKMRVFPNKFPFLKPEGNPIIRTDNNFFTFASAFGYHEVVVETPEHDKELWDLSAEEIKQVFEIYRMRIHELSKKENIKYVLVFKNSGADAGTSIVHTHTQIAAYNIIPRSIQKEEAVMKKYQKCPFCQIIEIEKQSHRRCFENERMVAFTPYASKFPFEIWVFPKSHKKSLLNFDDKEMSDLADIMSKILKKLSTINVPYNYFLHYGIEHLHFHIEITPRVAKWAGFELGSGTIINALPPEDAAKFYRGE
jgi:UDPglucose--hexose-1-phosphate uridylyltransferase